MWVGCKVEPPPAKAWWCPEVCLRFVVVEKLKYHRLKPGGVPNSDDSHIPTLLVLTLAKLLTECIINSPGRLLVKHPILRLLLAVLTFSIGVGLDRLTTKRRSVVEAAANVMYEARRPVAPTPHFIFRGESALPVSPPKPTLIFDYDLQKFYPLADYALTGKRPKGLSKDDSFFVTIWHLDDTDTSHDYVAFSIFDERGNTDLFASFALVTERRLFFVTQPTDEGFVYRFNGEFLRRGVIIDSAEGEVVLKGTLTKTKHDRTLVEWPVRFKVIHEGC